MCLEADRRGLKPRPEYVNAGNRRHRSSRRSRKLRSWASKRPVLAGVLTGLILFLALVIVLWVAVRAFSA